jgi:hypothetical protein
MRENYLQAKCITFANANGCGAWKVETPGRPGFPDVLIIFPGGRTAYVELKIATGSLRPSQIRTIDKILDLGAIVHVIDNFPDFCAVIEEGLDHGAAKRNFESIC